MSWSNDFVGIPFLDLGRDVAGCDCWGLARLVYAAQLGIKLPSYAEAYATTQENAEISLLLEARFASPWSPVAGDVMPFDLLLFRQGRADTHIGIAITDRIMLHMARGDSAKVESQQSPRMASRYVGAFRHDQSPFKAHLKVVL